MGHFARINEDNIVTDVIVIDNGAMQNLNFPESEEFGNAFIRDFLQLGGIWKQTSYNSNFRKNYAAVGMIYDDVRDAFYRPNPPEEGLAFNEETCRWILPDGRELP